MNKHRLGRIYESLERTLGFKVRRNKSAFKNDLAYHYAIAPYAKYAPWLNDDAYLQLYEKVKNHTLITEKARAYELWQLSEEVQHLEGDYIEIGSWRGGSGCIIAHKANKVSPGSSIYLCDTFTGVVKPGKEDSTYQGGEHADTSQQLVLDLVQQLELKDVHVLKGIFPDETAHLLKSDRFKFCHIDVDVFEGAKSITEWIWDKLVVGGVIVYDDFGFIDMPGVTKFVESQRGVKDRLVVHNLNGHGIIVKTHE